MSESQVVTGVADWCGVWGKLDRIRANVEHPRFADWWKRYLEGLRALGKMPDEPAGQAESLAFAFAVTGDASLGEKALWYLRAALPTYIPEVNVTHKEMYPELDADLGVAGACKRLAYTYGFLHPMLEPRDKQAVWDLLRECGGAIICRDALAGAWWGNAPNSNWTSHLMSGLALSGFVLMEDDPKVAEHWITTAATPLKVMLDLAGEEGAGIEGPGYWCGCYRSVQEFVEAERNRGGEDWYSHPFWERATEFPIYMSRPDLSGLSNYGDTGDRGLGSSHFFLAIASALNHGLAQWFGDTILRQSAPSIWDLMHYDASVESTPPDALPKDRVFTSVHIASFRSGWEPNAVYATFKGGSNSWSHCHLDLNSFCIDADGERLAVDPGPGDYSRHYFGSVDPEASTAWHNTITVDGGDQRQPPRYRMSFDLEEGGDAYSRLSDAASSEHIAMIRGDATTAYADTLERCLRDMVYLKPNCFVVYDTIQAREVRTQRHYQWILHGGFPIVDNEDGIFEVQGERSKLVIHPVLPLKRDAKLLPPRQPKAGKLGKTIHALALRNYWHHLWNVSPSQSPYPQWDARSSGPLYGRDVRFLVVLTVLPRDEAYCQQVERIHGTRVDGVRITNGDQEDWVWFNASGTDFEVDGIHSDAEKVVARKSKGMLVDRCIIRGQIGDNGASHLARYATLPVSPCSGQ